MRGGIPDLMITDLKMPNMSGLELLAGCSQAFPLDRGDRDER